MSNVHWGREPYTLFGLRTPDGRHAAYCPVNLNRYITVDVGNVELTSSILQERCGITIEYYNANDPIGTWMPFTWPSIPGANWVAAYPSHSTVEQVNAFLQSGTSPTINVCQPPCNNLTTPALRKNAYTVIVCLKYHPVADVTTGRAYINFYRTTMPVTDSVWFQLYRSWSCCPSCQDIAAGEPNESYYEHETWYTRARRHRQALYPYEACGPIAVGIRVDVRIPGNQGTWPASSSFPSGSQITITATPFGDISGIDGITYSPERKRVQSHEGCRCYHVSTPICQTTAQSLRRKYATIIVYGSTVTTYNYTSGLGFRTTGNGALFRRRGYRCFVTRWCPPPDPWPCGDEGMWAMADVPSDSSCAYWLEGNNSEHCANLLRDANVEVNYSPVTRTLSVARWICT